MPSAETVILDQSGVNRALTRVAHEIPQKNTGGEYLALIDDVNGAGLRIVNMKPAKISTQPESPLHILKNGGEAKSHVASRSHQPADNRTMLIKTSRCQATPGGCISSTLYHGRPLVNL